ncbi:MAG: hypothetical protein WBD20_04410 [Pirellulaceae bacterium]
MSHRLLATIMCGAGFLFASISWAQTKQEFESSYNENFLKRSSLLNKKLPDLEVYDEQGNPFRLAQSRGKHSVVVFGCLT